MKNHALQRKHGRDERRRRANERARSRQRATAQPVVMQTRDNVIAVDFGNTRPVMRAKSYVKFGLHEQEQAA